MRSYLMQLLSLLYFIVVCAADGSQTSDSTWSVTAVGILAIIVGFSFCFFGYRLLKTTVFLCGFIFFAIIAYNILESVAPDNSAGREVLYFVVCLIAGLIGGMIARFFWKVGIVIAGAALGYFVALFILSLKSDSLITSSWGRSIFILIFVIAGGILLFMFNRSIIIIGTSIGGSYLLMNGIDVFVKTGFTDNFRLANISSELVSYSTSPQIYAMIASMIVVAIIGMMVQFRVTGKHKREH